jgi:hypothetical protein
MNEPGALSHALSHASRSMDIFVSSPRCALGLLLCKWHPPGWRWPRAGLLQAVSVAVCVCQGCVHLDHTFLFLSRCCSSDSMSAPPPPPPPPSSPQQIPSLACGRCKLRKYASRDEQAADWACHRHECVPFDRDSVSGSLSLAALLQPACLRRLLGPYRRSDDGQWTIDPKAELAEVTCMVHLQKPRVVRVDPRWLSGEVLKAHLHAGLSVPREALSTLSRIWEAGEASGFSLRECALPDTTPLSVAEYWRWFASGKCGAFSVGVALMLQCLVVDFGVPMRHHGVLVTDFGTMSVMFTQPFVPVLRTYAEDSAHRPTDIDGMTNAAAHRVNYFTTSAGTRVFVDFTAAQFDAVPRLDMAPCLPVLLSEGEEELSKRGFSVCPGTFVSSASGTETELSESHFPLSGGSWDCWTSMLHLRSSLFHHVIAVQNIDLGALKRAHPDRSVPSSDVHCAGFDPADRPLR